MYAHRSAMAGHRPACTIPLTGTRVPRYHSHPVTRQGIRPDIRMIRTDADTRNMPAPTVCHIGRDPGYG